ncbi:MAG: CheR family methyltransferase [Actinomycetota bacterium]
MSAPANPLTTDEFTLFRDFIHANSGIYLDDYKKEALEVSLRALMRPHDLDRYADYYRLLERGEDGDEEFKKLLDLVTVNETCFFRNPAQFEVLKRHVLPEIINRKLAAGEKSIRVWSAGCSTGEEAYSVAITLMEALPDPKSWRIDILATDISRQVLGDAQQACYGAHALREIPPVVLRRYFKARGDGKQCLDPAIVDMVSFNYHNLVKEPYPLLILGGWDIIFCRNVTIYFKLETVRAVVGGFYNALRDGGYLFIGHAESLYKVSDDFIPVHLGHAYVYKKDLAARAASPETGVAPLIIATEKDKGAEANVKTRKLVKPAPRHEFRREEDKEGVYARAYEHFVREEFDEAAALAVKFAKADPDSTQGHVLLANIYINQGRNERALKEARTVLMLEPTSAKGHYLLGLIKERQGRVDDAVAEYKQVLRLDSGFALAHMNLAEIYKGKYMAAEAEREYNSAIEALGHSPRGDWADFAGGFLGDVLVEACKRSLGQLAGND